MQRYLNVWLNNCRCNIYQTLALTADWVLRAECLELVWSNVYKIQGGWSMFNTISIVKLSKLISTIIHVRTGVRQFKRMKNVSCAHRIDKIIIHLTLYSTPFLKKWTVNSINNCISHETITIHLIFRDFFISFIQFTVTSCWETSEENCIIQLQYHIWQHSATMELRTKQLVGEILRVKYFA